MAYIFLANSLIKSLIDRHVKLNWQTKKITLICRIKHWFRSFSLNLIPEILHRDIFMTMNLSRFISVTPVSSFAIIHTIRVAYTRFTRPRIYRNTMYYWIIWAGFIIWDLLWFYASPDAYNRATESGGDKLRLFWDICSINCVFYSLVILFLTNLLNTFLQES